MKLWAGRFQKQENEKVNDFNSSISFDSRMYMEDIDGSIAHATMLCKIGVISQQDAAMITSELANIKQEISDGVLQIDPTAEDIHTFIEGELTQRIGDAGKRLHTARSRNDQVALDIRLTLRKEIASIVEKITALIEVLCSKASAHTKTIMPGYTHLQRAQPITFGHYLMAYTSMFLRDISRLKDTNRRMDDMPLGAGALAGTTYPLDRAYTAELLGFSKVGQNSLDCVSDRDFVLELLSTLSILMMHLSRFSEEIILFSSWEFQFIELDDAFSTGSSIMPQKKNPDIAELVRGKTGRVYGDLMALLTVMKGIPLAYNKDMQEDKEAVFDAIDTVNICLDTFTPMIETMKIKTEQMYKAASKGFINATDCADYLVRKGMPFRSAYKITGEIVFDCIKNNFTLETYPLENYQAYSLLFTEDIYDAINLEHCVKERISFGGPSESSVLQQIAYAKQQLTKD